MAPPPVQSAVAGELNNIEIELGPSHEPPQNQHSDTIPPQRIVEQSLPPHDHGIAAWRLLTSAFVFEALLWGFPLSFGVFQDYYSHLPQFKDNPYISAIGSTASGISYFAAPFVIPFIKKHSRHRRLMICIGWPISILSLIAGSFATTLGSLIFTQGILYGIGFIIFYYPILSFVGEFWITRRGMAAGILCSASGVSGAIFPFLVRTLLIRYGYPTTLRAMAIGLALLTGPLIPLLKGRLPDSQVVSGPGRTDWSFWKARLFWIYNASNLAMGFGYFFPSLYLPSYATANGLNSTQGALLLAMMSVSQVLGQMSFGYLSDGKVPIDLLASTSALVAAIATLAIWGLAHSFELILVFALLYGFFGAGYTAMWVRMGTTVSTEPSASFAVYGLLNLGKGVGNVLAGPISGGLLKGTIKMANYGVLKYESVVIFTGVCMFLSGFIIIAFCNLQLDSALKFLRTLVANREIEGHRAGRGRP